VRQERAPAHLTGSAVGQAEPRSVADPSVRCFAPRAFATGLPTIGRVFALDAGDRVIQATADRLRQAVRKNDIVGRIRRILSEPLEIHGGTLHVAAGIGVVRTDRADSRDAATLLREADTAMYAAKAGGEGPATSRGHPRPDTDRTGRLSQTATDPKTPLRHPLGGVFGARVACRGIW